MRPITHKMSRQQQPRPPSSIGGARSRRSLVPSRSSHHALERQFLCFTILLALLSYAVLHIIQYHGSDSGDERSMYSNVRNIAHNDINKSTSQNRQEHNAVRKNMQKDEIRFRSVCSNAESDTL